MTQSEKIRVLVVDDIAETCENIRKLLQFEYDVEVIGTAKSGREGIQLVQELDPDVILMDINMPGMDGLKATKIITDMVPYIQVVILSVQGDPNYMRRALLAGARDFFTKPPMADELISAVRRAGELAAQERKKPGSNKAKIRSLLLKEQELKLTWFDLDARLDLYNQNIVTGRVVDRIETLVAGIAHDIRSPINIILSILSTLDSNDREIIKAFKKIWRRSTYCKWVADNFLGISLSEKKSEKVMNLRFVVNEVVSLLENRISSTVEIENRIGKETQVYADPWLLRLVLLNLISNAVESLTNAGKISIYFEIIKEKAAIFVRDNGNQIPTNNIQNLFNLGFSTKKLHAGIGLYVSKRLLRQQKGDLNFARDFHYKTKYFNILLPNQTLIDRQSFIDRQSLTVELLDHRINNLKESISILQEEISRFRKQSITSAQQEEISKVFRQLTATFSQNLSNELLIIETAVLDVIQKLQSDDTDIKNSLQKIIRNCSYCSLLVSNIKELDEGISPNFQEISLIDTINEVLYLVDRKLPKELYTVDQDFDITLPDIQADDVQIKQVFMNLIKNALDAMPNGGTLRIKLFQEGKFATFDIGDSGAGIHHDNLDRLFQLGFTTKEKGYGIGLYSVKNIIDRHHGTIKVLSIINQGTTFTVQLPMKQSKLEA